MWSPQTLWIFVGRGEDHAQRMVVTARLKLLWSSGRMAFWKTYEDAGWVDWIQPGVHDDGKWRLINTCAMSSGSTKLVKDKKQVNVTSGWGVSNLRRQPLKRAIYGNDTDNKHGSERDGMRECQMTAQNTIGSSLLFSYSAPV